MQVAHVYAADAAEDAVAKQLLEDHCAHASCIAHGLDMVPRKVAVVPPALDIIEGDWAAFTLSGVSREPPILLQLGGKVVPVFAILPLSMIRLPGVFVLHTFERNARIEVLRTHAGAYRVPTLRYFCQHYTRPMVRDVPHNELCEWCAQTNTTNACTDCKRRVCIKCVYATPGRDWEAVLLCPHCAGTPDVDTDCIDHILSVMSK